MIRAGSYSAKKVLAGQGRGNKYNARKVYLDGYTFDSAREGRHYIVLKHRRNAGEISELVIHPKFDLIVNGVVVGTYTGDFSYIEDIDGQYVVDDEKGVKARDFAIRSKVFMACFPNIELRINGIPAKKPKPPKKARAA